jgi:hypothetical protein
MSRKRTNSGVSWQRRLQELLLAGGSLAAVSCGDAATPATSIHVACGNGLADPCICGRDSSPEGAKACDQKRSCDAKGLLWSSLVDGGCVTDASALVDDGGPLDGS